MEGRLLRRENRFRVAVEMAGNATTAHLANPGRLSELLIPGRICYLVPQPAPHRRTPYDLLLIPHAGVLVSVDSRLPNRLFIEAVEAGRLASFADVTSLASEVRHGQSRLDFRLTGPQGDCWVETKSVTLVEAGLALFPDAPTRRGQRHLADLAALARKGGRAAVVFVIQRPDATAFSPHVATDPAFARGLADAAIAGVEIWAFRCSVTREEIHITDEVPVLLPPNLGTR